MPIYEYRCENGHLFEVLQRMSDDALTECTECGAPVQRVFHPVAVHFKGSGFYNTDYGKQKRGKAAEAGGGESGGDSSSDSKSDSSKSSSDSPKSSDSGSSKPADSGSKKSAASSGSSD